MYKTYKEYLTKFGVGVASNKQLKENTKTKYQKFSEYLEEKGGAKNG